MMRVPPPPAPPPERYVQGCMVAAVTIFAGGLGVFTSLAYLTVKACIS